jgi:hypothetical protein
MDSYDSVMRILVQVFFPSIFLAASAVLSAFGAGGLYVHAIILLVFERCKVLVMFSGMICDGVCKMELYCERCCFVFEKRYRCRGRVSGKTLRAQCWKQRRPVENFWESTTGVLSEIDSEKRKIKIDFCFILSSTIHPMAVRSFPNGCQ